MIKFIFGLTLTLVVTTSKAQKLNLEDVISLAENKSKVETDTLSLCNFYPIDGVLFTQEDFEKEIELLAPSDIKFAAIAKLSSPHIHHPCSYILLTSIGRIQSRKYKLNLLNTLRINLKENLPKIESQNYNCEKCSQLIVDGVPIKFFKALNLVNKLKPKDIQFIISYEPANSETLSLTEILLKKKDKAIKR